MCDEASAQEDTPPKPIIASTSKIVNVNVRGKRGNIVQTYPAVEYDFSPNQIAVNIGDYIHFQWQGTDYNPRRGCNDAEGGPPDPNDYVSPSKNNARADRSNVVFMDTMAENIPMDYLGGTETALTTSATLAQAAVLPNVPCNEAGAKASCMLAVMRLAHSRTCRQQ